MGQYNEYRKNWIKKESPAEKKKRAAKILAGLDKLNPESKTALLYKTPMQMLAAVILSAQATDKMVNIVTAELFKKYKTPKDFANANPKIFSKEISRIGLYQTKAKAIIATAKLIEKNFGGKIPKTIEDLITLRGVGRKTASIVLWNVHELIGGIAVDTHVRRVSQRLGLTKHDDPNKIEKDLMEIYKDKKEMWPKVNTLFIDHGRAVCQARSPKCVICPLNKICPSAKT
ncbi:MAG: endonuclease III [Candidatus Sungbacteria bacterium]|uniref:Endonuclease III n=1 Tax=Candidatus Sungiibacteriota bacterium TaxID=2750080 RepID=A0A9D6QS41_9BACT|nr:endonuclease III [Candidatus Sungbacteria bacterium]